MKKRNNYSSLFLEIFTIKVNNSLFEIDNNDIYFPFHTDS